LPNLAVLRQRFTPDPASLPVVSVQLEGRAWEVR